MTSPSSGYGAWAVIRHDVESGATNPSVVTMPTVSRHRRSSDLRETNLPLGVRFGAPRRIIFKSAVSLVILLSVFGLIQCLLPLRTTIQIGADEGFELAKATLCLKGHRLYSEVWNDQPPLHTFIITQILKHLAPSILGPRLVTAIFTAILLASIFLISFRVSGLLVAALTAVVLIASPGFVELSSSCMLEIPALAPAVAALCLMLICNQNKCTGIP